MAYVNVLEWKAEQVADWLRGLDDVVYPYAHFFLNNDVTGQGLLNLTVDDLYKLHVEKLGHQEIILESLELLRNFHYNLDQENLQYICLRLSCKARSLYNEMSMNLPKAGEKQVVRAPVMSSVAEVLESVRLLLSWLERKPFDVAPEYHTVRTTLISLSLEMATNAQRDTFAEQPMDVIRSCCDKLALLADKVIQQFTDPLILQPASLDVATVRKRAEEELGIVLEPLVHGVHLVTETRMVNPAARVEPGDEIVQVNYQTVVGWQTKKVLQLMCENPVELILTLKKRPRHSNLGQLYMKPFRIPARKKSAYYINNLPSPRTELLVVPDVSLPITKKRNPSESSSDLGPLSETETDSEDDEAFLPVAASQVADQITGARQSNASPTQSLRSVLSRPRSAPQRRATISGTSPSHFRPYINVSEIWTGLRDTSVDFPSSTLSSKDSGVSTLSKAGGGGEKEEENEDVPELRREKRMRGGVGPTPRPVTAMPSVTSAPNLLRHSAKREPADHPLSGQDTRKDPVNISTKVVSDGQKIKPSESRKDGEEGHRLSQHSHRTGSEKESHSNWSGQDSSRPGKESHNCTIESQRSVESNSSKHNKPRMPDPPATTVITTSEPLHVSRIHVTGPHVTHVATNPSYMNVPAPSHLHEYVNVDPKDGDPSPTPLVPEYVNVPSSSTDHNTLSSPSRQPLPKPRSAGRGSVTEAGGGSPGQRRHQTDQGSHHSDRASAEHPENSNTSSQGINHSKTGTIGGRGKRPVPLPRRLSTISSGGSTPGMSPPATPSRNSPSGTKKISASSEPKFQVQPSAAATAGRGVRGGSVSSSSQGQQQAASPRRRSSTVELPAPTANFKSYRRVVQPSPVSKDQARRASCAEEGQGSGRQRIGLRQGSGPPPTVNKSKSMTKLSFDQQPKQQGLSRVDSGLGLGSNHTSISSAESLRLSSVSSTDSGNFSCHSPTVRVPSGLKGSALAPQSRADFIRRPSGATPHSPLKGTVISSNPQGSRMVCSPQSKVSKSTQQELLDAEQRNRRRSGHNFSLDYPEYEQI